MVFHKCFRLFDALITFIFIIVIITHWGLFLFLLSFQVHFWSYYFLIIREMEPFPTC